MKGYNIQNQSLDMQWIKAMKELKRSCLKILLGLGILKRKGRQRKMGEIGRKKRGGGDMKTKM